MRYPDPEPVTRSIKLAKLAMLLAATGAVIQLIAFCGQNMVDKPTPPQPRPVACTSVTVALKLAMRRLANPATTDAGRDIAIVIAPWVASCTGRPRHQTELDGLAASTDAAADVAIVRRILDEIGPEAP